MKNIILALILGLSSTFTTSCSTVKVEQAEPYIEPLVYLAATAFLDKSDNKTEDAAALIKVADNLLLVSQVLDEEVASEDFSTLVQSSGSGKEWVVFSSYLFNIYRAKLSESGIDKVKGSKIIISLIAKGLKQAVTTSGK
jgi:hypothetical protein